MAGSADDDARWRRTTAEVALPGLVVDDPTPAVSAFDPPRDRFALGEELGRGGMGRVVAAIDVALQRPVAIKQPLAAGDRARFEREVRITARLEHPAIVAIHDAGRDDRGEPYYVMRRIEGEPLAARIAAGGRLALLPNVLAAADAAAFAHARGVVHRDIKPANIVLGAHGETLLIDWGLARAIDEPDDGAAGTPGFMAPELARGEPADPRSDVYALGATLACVLTGTPDGALDEVADELAAIATRAVAAPAERYRDAGELAADLRRFLTGQLVAAHRYSGRALVIRWVRRHRAAVIATAAAILAIAAVVVIAFVRIVGERDDATRARGEAAARADQMLVERASLLATRDPAAAIAVLARLPAGSALTDRARDVAAVAAAGGIAHGLTAHRGAVRAIELAGDRLLSTGDDGAVRVHDLARGTSRTVAEGAHGGYAIWADGAIVFSSWRALQVVDVATGAVRVLASDVVVSALWRVEHHVRYVDRERQQVIELDLRGGTAVIANDAGRDPLVLVDGVQQLRAGAALATGDDTLEIRDAAGLHAITHHKPGTLALAADDTYVALGASDGTIAWWRIADVAPPPRPIAIGSEVVGADATHDYVIDHGALQIIAIDHATGARRTVADGIMFGGPVTPRGEMLVSQASARLTPAILDVHTGAQRALPDALVVADRTTGRIVIAQARTLREPLATGDRVLATTTAEITMLGVAGRWAAALAGRRLARVDADGAITWLALWTAPDHLAISDDGTLWCAFDRALWRWDGRALIRASVLPSPVTALVTVAGGVAVVLLDQSLWHATPTGVINRLASGDHRGFAFGERVAIVTEANRRTRIALATGERATWTSDTLQTAIALGPGDLTVVQTQDHDGAWLTRFADPVPAALPAWLARATNATLDPATDALTWPD